MRLQKLLVDSNEADKIDGEQPTLYNVLQMKRREERTIYGLRFADGVMRTKPTGIARTLTTYLREKTTVVDSRSIQLLEITWSQRKSYKFALQNSFDHEEIYQAICARGGGRKAPGIDGIFREFYICNWTLYALT